MKAYQWAIYLLLSTACISIPKDDYASIQRTSLPAVRISPSTSPQEDPAVSESKVVWEEKVLGHSQIFLYDLKDGTRLQLTSDPFDHYRPAISDHVVVWENELGSNGKIRITIGGIDLSTMKPLAIPDTILAQSALTPRVWKNTVVWAEQDPIFAIVELDLTTLATRILYSSSEYVISPDVYNNIVVWEGMRGDNSDIFAYDLLRNKEFVMVDKAGNQRRPRIWEDTVVWMDSRGGDYDIYGYDLKKAQEFVISDRSGDEVDPHIFNGIVVWRDSHGEHMDIVASTLFTKFILR